MVKNRTIVVIFSLMFFGVVGFAQGITTASSYFKSISDYYATLNDYEADVEIVADRQRMKAHVSFKKPNLLRLDFSTPQEQVIVFNGDMLTIYLPGAAAVLQQSVQSDGSANGANLATPQGLSLLSRYYTVAYELGPDPVILEEGSDEKVVKLLLTRRNSSEAFRSIKLAVNSETKLIRRIEAVTTKAEVFSFDFLEYGLNQNISDQRFLYDAPSSANNYNNFLFTE
ncbi:MAG: outer membrane lipoprotein carrier protein LolA [Treponema sp.]|nr:outer membrane lipoprotein carrier protein LolA [Treponema sp.]MBD5406831.1 outer membrane lipoprotein carrier protein LolA [Treponema sp.]MBD5412004.1 outer membrane lipoprotein carrier protein LolA [Treponema sp.]MBD5414265.1 outer membrane lipoprotein carrier protein LolA [Treponema sp.]